MSPLEADRIKPIDDNSTVIQHAEGQTSKMSPATPNPPKPSDPRGHGAQVKTS